MFGAKRGAGLTSRDGRLRWLREYRLPSLRGEYAARRIGRSRQGGIYRLLFAEDSLGCETRGGQSHGLAARNARAGNESTLLPLGHEAIEDAVNTVVDGEIALRESAARWSAEAESWE